MSDGTDTLRVLLAQSGDREALDQLFRSVQESLFHRVSAIVGDPDSTKDVLQDVFVLLQRKLKHLRDPAHFQAWAMRIAVRESVRRAGRNRRASSVIAGDAVLGSIPDPRGTDPLRSLAAAEAVAVIRQLPAGSRAVLTLHYLDDLPLKEVATVLRIPIGTVKSRLSHGLSALRQRLQSDPINHEVPTRGDHE